MPWKIGYTMKRMYSLIDQEYVKIFFVHEFFYMNDTTQI